MAVTKNPQDLSQSTSSEGSMDRSGSCHAPGKEASEAQPSAETGEALEQSNAAVLSAR